MSTFIAPGLRPCIYGELLVDTSVNRKGKDYTYLYGKHVGTGSLTPFIDDAFDDRIDE